MAKGFYIYAGPGSLMQEGFVKFNGNGEVVDADLPLVAHSLAAKLLRDGKTINQVETEIKDWIDDSVFWIGIFPMEVMHG